MVLRLRKWMAYKNTTNRWEVTTSTRSVVSVLETCYKELMRCVARCLNAYSYFFFFFFFSLLIHVDACLLFAAICCTSLECYIIYSGSRDDIQTKIFYGKKFFNSIHRVWHALHFDFPKISQMTRENVYLDFNRITSRFVCSHCSSILAYTCTRSRSFCLISAHNC